ncbi:unnamed protein product [Blepharisma stoltei]|uniref:GTP-binding protein n=1 Tax=Blepharisma stoltei TaxID=1481888 RepID=A0AAU9KAB4_9CILI|nr:unnamed protein product [Blepharisma stoltei]
MDRAADYLMKFVIVGFDRAGKSSLVLTYAGEGFSEYYVNTIGVDFKVRSMDILGKLIKFQLWDTAGHPRFHVITNSYFRGASGLIIVMDLTNPSALDNAKYWKGELNKQFSDEKPVLLIGNKTDLHRAITYEEAKRLADEWGIIYIETSAKTKYNVNKAFEILIRSALHAIQNPNLYKIS